MQITSYPFNFYSDATDADVKLNVSHDVIKVSKLLIKQITVYP